MAQLCQSSEWHMYIDGERRRVMRLKALFFLVGIAVLAVLLIVGALAYRRHGLQVGVVYEALVEIALAAERGKRWASRDVQIAESQIPLVVGTFAMSCLQVHLYKWKTKQNW